MFQNELYNIFENHPAYSIQEKDKTYDLNTQRQLSFRQAMIMKFTNQLDLSSIIENVDRQPTSVRTMIFVAPSSYIKNAVGDGIFNSAILTMGTERHQSFMDDCREGKVI